MMYFITEPGFCQHFFGNIFEIPEKERLFIHFSFIFYASALLCEGLGDTDAGRRGGKTGPTSAAGNCLILLARDTSGNPYIAVILKSAERGILYTEMNALLKQATS